MQIRADQLHAHLAKGLRSLYTVFGDEPLLAQEAVDAIRQAARQAGHSERKVYHVVGNHFNWSEVEGALQAMSLFAERQIIELRIPGGKPGKEGSEALQRYCTHMPDEVVTIIQLPKLDRTQQGSAWFGALESAGATIRVDPIERASLSGWLAQRLNANGQRVEAGEQGQRTLAFFADRVEGNLLAAHQEIQKLGLLYPAGELSFEQVEAAVLNVARYDVFKLGEAVLAGQVARALRMLDGLQAEGEAAVLVHWTLSEDVRALKRVKDAMAAGRPLAMALRDNRVWGARERLFDRALQSLSEDALSALVEAAHICDGLVKGLRHPDWPVDGWQGLRRLMLMMLQHTAMTPQPSRSRAPAQSANMKSDQRAKASRPTLVLGS